MFGKFTEAEMKSKEAEKINFFELAGKLSATSDPFERKRIKEALARMTFAKK
jgi:hypothetical protein